jgi:hypothetical protein
MKMHKLVILALAILHISGCVAYQAFPYGARSGDTITIAVGSPDGMTKTNTTVVFTSDVDDSTANLPIRAMIRLRPDNTSFVANFNPMIQSIENFDSHSAWLTVLVIDLPEGMTAGTGKLDITTAGVYQLGQGVNAETIAIEILPGTGSAASFDYFNNVVPGQTVASDLSQAEPAKQVVVKPPAGNLGYSKDGLGAAEIKITVPSESYQGPGIPVDPDDIRVVMDDSYHRNPIDQTQMSWSKTGDVYTVYFISPTGTMIYNQTRFSVILFPLNTYLPGLSVDSVTFYDVNGTVVTAGLPNAGNYTISLEY